MENPFKNIVQNQQASELLKEKVMGDIRLIKLSLDLTDLFVVKSPNSVLDLLDSTTNKNQ